MFDGVDAVVSVFLCVAAGLGVLIWWLLGWRTHAGKEADTEEMRQKEIFRAGRAAEAKLLGCSSKIFRAGDVFVDLKLSGLQRWTAQESIGRDAKEMRRLKEMQRPLLENDQCEEPKVYRERIHYIACLDGEDADEKNPAIVLWHGYGLGAGALAKALEELAAEFPGQSVYAPDWLGCGLSSRPYWLRKLLRYSCPNLDGRHPEDVGEMLAFVDFVEGMFLQAFEQWREQVIGDRRKMILIGHSLGGYLSACYAERSDLAQNIAALVLASPVGVGSWRPEHAECDSERLIRRSTLESQFGKEYSELKHNVTPYSFVPADAPWEELSLKMRMVATLAKHFLVRAWELRLIIHDAIGGLPLPSCILLPVFAWFSSEGRFKDNGQWNSAHEGYSQRNVAAYLYEIFRLPASGDFAITVLMEPGPWARKPLEMRIPRWSLLRPGGGVPVAFIYGDVDWMDRDGTERLMKKFPDLKSLVCENSGHTMYMDNPRAFAKCVRNAVDQRCNGDQRSLVS